MITHNYQLYFKNDESLNSSRIVFVKSITPEGPGIWSGITLITGTNDSHHIPLYVYNSLEAISVVIACDFSKPNHYFIIFS